MEDEQFNMSLRKFLKKVGVTSQHEIERVVREQRLEGKGILKVKMVLTAEGTDLKHEVEDQIDLSLSTPKGEVCSVLFFVRRCSSKVAEFPTR